MAKLELPLTEANVRSCANYYEFEFNFILFVEGSGFGNNAVQRVLVTVR
jgi:hypothetical protein